MVEGFISIFQYLIIFWNSLWISGCARCITDVFQPLEYFRPLWTAPDPTTDFYMTWFKWSLAQKQDEQLECFRWERRTRHWISWWLFKLIFPFWLKCHPSLTMKNNLSGGQAEELQGRNRRWVWGHGQFVWPLQDWKDWKRRGRVKLPFLSGC